LIPRPDDGIVVYRERLGRNCSAGGPTWLQHLIGIVAAESSVGGNLKRIKALQESRNPMAVARCWQ
jgi:hypothetical protein